MLRTNEKDLVIMSVMGHVAHPVKGAKPYLVTHDGKIKVLPGVGGITYNKRVGDPCVGLAGDHVEPGVSTRNTDKFDGDASAYNSAYNALSCVGNEAVVVSGDAKGARGVVTGKHGGIEHVLIDFPPETLDKLVIGDKILVKAYGQGLELLDYPEIAVRNLDPRLLAKLPIKKKGDGLAVGVAKLIPGEIMGSGLGSDHVWTGDYDIQLFDDDTVKKFGLSDLRFGDIVAVLDADHTYGRIYKKGAVSVGVIVHSACLVAGHGPGVTTLLTTGVPGKLEPYTDKGANIAFLMGIRENG
ncbi:MAG: DUF4438 domain-containing protein [candidate division WOR-3 bacterium]